MKKETGWVTTAAITAAAVLGFSHFSSPPPPSSTSGQTQTRQTVAKARPSKESSQPKLRYACEEIEKRLERFIPAKGGPVPGSCVDSGAVPNLPSTENQNPDLHFLIATLPDPVHTHFSLLFDRSVEAIQQAAQDQGYDYDSSWLPWIAETHEYSRLQDQLLSDDLNEWQEQQPGIMVFRKSLSGREVPYHQGLIVFVVGEFPTGGINEEQFQNAIKWITALRPQGTQHSLRLLSPFFSGSFPSLLKLLSNPTVTAFIQENTKSIAVPAGLKADEMRPVEIISGSATSAESIKAFVQQLSPGIRFRSLLENDDVATDRYCQYLDAQGYDPAKLAIVSEDETAYGTINTQSTSTDLNKANPDTANVLLPHCNYIDNKRTPHGPLYFYYPRDIASLRSAYEQQSIFSSGKQSDQANAPRTALQEDLSEPGKSEQDTVQTYGGNQTPLSQESTLYEMTNLLKAHQVEFIILRSSNPLDQIFLVRFLRRAYPNGRIVISGSDLLFRRSPESANFRGIMVLSTFPLFSWQQDWTYWPNPYSSHSHRAFTMEGAQGLYLAGRFLVDGEDQTVYDNAPLAINHSNIIIQDYGPPSWLLCPCDCPAKMFCEPGTRPPTWLSVVGNGQFWPVAALDENTLYRQLKTGRRIRPENIDPIPGVSPRAITGAQCQAVFLTLPLPMRICLLLSFLWAGWHFYCCYRGSQTASPRCLAYFSPMPLRRQRILIFIGSLVLALWVVILTTFTGIFSPGGAPFFHPGRLALFYILLFLLSLAALIASHRVCRSPSQVTKEEERLDGIETLRKDLKEARQRAAARKHDLNRLKQRDTDLEKAEQIRLEFHHSRDKVKKLKREIKELRWNAWKRRAFKSLKMARPSIAWFICLVLALLGVFYRFITLRLSPGARVFSYWRSVNLLTGVSPLMPFLLLTAGMYGWFWFTLRGFALFNHDRPQLPRLCALLPALPMFSREKAGRPIEKAATPLSCPYLMHLVIMLFFLIAGFVAFAAAEDFAVRGLGNIDYGRIFFVWLNICVAVTLADAWQMLTTWSRLRQLLVYLDRLPLRRTLDALKGFSWGTVWKMGGNVLEQRYRLLSRQIESLRHLQNSLKELPAAAPGLDFSAQVEDCQQAILPFTEWFSHHHNDPELCDTTEFAKIQEKLARLAGLTMNTILLPAWHGEKQSLILDYSRPAAEDVESSGTHPAASLPEHVRAAEEFFLLPYLGFIQNILGRIRTMVFGMVCLFLGATLSVASYPFDPRPVLSAIFLIVFVVVGAAVFFVYAEMHRDSTLSHITNTNPGELGVDFWMKLVAFGAGPLLALLTALFPEIANFIGSWLQPSVEAIK
ncbi:MAG: hypothetical protein WCC87_04680 [Candidatus Korobacteraceae bacterium]